MNVPDTLRADIKIYYHNRGIAAREIFLLKNERRAEILVSGWSLTEGLWRDRQQNAKRDIQ